MKKIFLSILCIGMVLTSACEKKEKEKTVDSDPNVNTTKTVNIETKGYYKDDYVELKYIPQGFILTEHFSTEKQVNLMFTRQDKNFGFGMSPVDSNATYDTENATIEELFINGNPAVFSTKPNVNILVWTDGNKKFDMAGNISQKEMIKIAENAQSLK